MSDTTLVTSKAIAIAEFRQILMWPLALDMAGAASSETMASAVKKEAERLGCNTANPWTRIPDPLFHLRHEIGAPADPQQRQEAYAEFVYFHDFVQRFLFPPKMQHQAGASLLHLFERRDIHAVKIVLPTEWDAANNRSIDREFTLRVDRCNLYLFPAGVAVLAVEVTTGEAVPEAHQLPPLALSDVLYLQDYFRRCYAAAYDGASSPMFVPKSVQWLDQDGHAVGDESKPPALATDREMVVNFRTAPVFDHWSLLLPLRFKGSAEAPGILWRHIVDERIPFMSYVRLAAVTDKHIKTVSSGDNLARIHRGDLMRLCFADTPGDLGSYPYDKDFLSGFDDENLYRRYHRWGTLHMFSSYSYVMLTAEGDRYQSFTLNHFRHMYFQMALIAHMEHAAYLAFSNRLSEAVAEASEAQRLRSPAFRDRIISIQEEFLRFVQLFRFTGLSNQMQAKDMFDLWRKHLRLQPLYEDVRDELKSATDFLLATETRQQTNAATRLNKIAIAGVLLSLVFSFLGMNLIWDAESIKIMLGQTSPPDGKQDLSLLTIGQTLPPDGWSLLTALGRGIAGFGVTLVAFALLFRLFVVRWFTAQSAIDDGTVEIKVFLGRMVWFGLLIACTGVLTSALHSFEPASQLAAILGIGASFVVAVWVWIAA
jgi:hypothetical protein